jgi:hypothetical protein
MKTFKEFTLNEVDFNPQIQIQGIGVMSLHHAMKRVNEMLTDLAERSKKEPTVQNWQTIETLLDRQTINAYVSSITAALKRIN